MSDVDSTVDSLIKRVSSEMSSKFRGHVTYAECKHACQWYLWDHPSRVKAVETEPDGRSRLLSSLWATCFNFCQQQKADALGYKTEDIRYWTLGDVESLLDCLWDDSAWLEPPKSEGRSTRAPHEGGGWIATLSDLSYAVSRQSKEDRQVLEEWHAHGNRNELVSFDRIERAHKRVLKTLGGPPPRTRVAHDEGDCECGRVA